METDLSAAEQYNRDVQAKLQEITSNHEHDRTMISIQQSPVESTALVKRAHFTDRSAVSAAKSALPLGTLFLLLLGFITNFKSQSASSGFCDSNAATNDIILNRQSALDDANACIARKTALDLDQPGAGQAIHCDVSALPLVPFVPRATACAPCGVRGGADRLLRAGIYPDGPSVVDYFAGTGWSPRARTSSVPAVVSTRYGQEEDDRWIGQVDRG
jgi:hypothetical protein